MDDLYRTQFERQAAAEAADGVKAAIADAAGPATRSGGRGEDRAAV